MDEQLQSFPNNQETQCIHVNGQAAALLYEPVHHVFKHLTSIVLPVMPQSTASAGRCDCCGRNASQFGGEFFIGKDGYGTVYQHCAACESFNVGDIDILGIERNEKILPDGTKIGVAHKFGMMSGSGCLVESDGSVTVFTPPGTYKKLPESFLTKFNVISCTAPEQIRHISQMELKFPLVYIANFGRKTTALITGLRYSYSRNRIVMCTDDGNESATEALNTFDLDAIMSIVAMKETVSNVLWNEFKRQVSLLASGSSSPAKFTSYIEKIPASAMSSLLCIYRQLPIDPHQRLALLRQVEKIAS